MSRHSTNRSRKAKSARPGAGWPEAGMGGGRREVVEWKADRSPEDPPMSPMRAPERRLAPTPADTRFELTSEFQPKGDQPAALHELVEGICRGDRNQVLLGVTGSGRSEESRIGK